MNEKQLALLDQILVQGFATTSVPILGGKAEITFSSMTAGDQLHIESEMKSVDTTTPAHFLHNYSIKMLGSVLKKYTVLGKEPVIFNSPKEAEAFIKSRPSTVVDAMVQAQGNLEKELAVLSKATDVEENFTSTPSDEQKQK
jgi:hypothetical protein